jgi:hypothetical protein
MDPELEELPTDYNRGLDFNMKKTSKGGYADYSTSNWARKESPLTEAELAAIEAHGLFNLADFLPKKPSEAELRIIKEMFEASVDGRPYDAEKWGAYYKPWGLEVANSSRQDDDSDEFESRAAPAVRTQAPAPVAASTPVAESAPWEDEAPAAQSPVEVPAAKSNANDILAMIRSRQNKPA